MYRSRGEALFILCQKHIVSKKQPGVESDGHLTSYGALCRAEHRQEEGQDICKKRDRERGREELRGNNDLSTS